jgi:hypothetical protein
VQAALQAHDAEDEEQRQLPPQQLQPAAVTLRDKAGHQLKVCMHCTDMSINCMRGHVQ